MNNVCVISGPRIDGDLRIYYCKTHDCEIVVRGAVVPKWCAFGKPPDAEVDSVALFRFGPGELGKEKW